MDKYYWQLNLAIEAIKWGGVIWMLGVIAGVLHRIAKLLMDISVGIRQGNIINRKREPSSKEPL